MKEEFHTSIMSVFVDMINSTSVKSRCSSNDSMDLKRMTFWSEGKRIRVKLRFQENIPYILWPTAILLGRIHLVQ